MKRAETNVDYSIIIPVFNEEKYIENTLISVQKSQAAFPSYVGEIIIVDNESTDNTVDIAKKMGAHVVQEVVHNIGRVRNCGAKHAKGRYLIFLDADTPLTEETLKIILDSLQSNILGGGFLLKPDIRNSLLIKVSFFNWNCIARLFQITTGSCVFCLKSAFEQVGGFNEEYYACEDFILCKDLKLLGKKIGKKFIINSHKITFCCRKFKPITFRLYLSLSKLLIIGLLNPNYFKIKKNCARWYKD